MKQRRGFTVVELLIVIVIIASLALLTVFAFGSWRERTARTELQQELSTVSASLNNYRNFNNGYPGVAGGAPVSPTTLNGLAYRPNAGVTMTYSLRTDGLSYCLKATSVAVASEPSWYIDSAVSATSTKIACS